MSNLKLTLLALIMAFATATYAGSPKAPEAKSDAKASSDAKSTTENKTGLTTYYAIKVDNPAPGAPTFTWTTDISETEGLRCNALTNSACEISVSTPPTDGHVPTGQTVTNEAYQ